MGLKSLQLYTLWRVTPYLLGTITLFVSSRRTKSPSPRCKTRIPPCTYVSRLNTKKSEIFHGHGPPYCHSLCHGQECLEGRTTVSVCYTSMYPPYSWYFLFPRLSPPTPTVPVPPLLDYICLVQFLSSIPPLQIRLRISFRILVLKSGSLLTRVADIPPFVELRPCK